MCHVVHTYQWRRGAVQDTNRERDRVCDSGHVMQLMGLGGGGWYGSLPDSVKADHVNAPAYCICISFVSCKSAAFRTL